MKRNSVEDGAVRVATYSRYHRAVVNDDGTIDIYREPTGRTCDSDVPFQEKTRRALENINRSQSAYQCAGARPPGSVES